MATQIKIRRDTAANFTTANPILGGGEPALETDTLKEKIGDGATAWTSLPYRTAGASGTFMSANNKLITVEDGLIISMLLNGIDLTVLPYGAIIAESITTNVFHGTPSLLKTSTGRLLFAHDYFGSATGFDTIAIYKSDDNGQTSTKITDIVGIIWMTLFEYNNDQYIIGVSDATTSSNVVITKSTDDGDTWSALVTVLTNPVGYEGFGTSSMPPIFKDGYLVKAFELVENSSGETWASIYNEVMVFADLTDLMNPSSWSMSNIVPFDGTAFVAADIYRDEGYEKRPSGSILETKGFLEGNLVELSNGDLRIYSRVESAPNSNYANYLDVTWNSGTPTSSTISTTHNFIKMFGGGCKFHIIWDSVSSKHWSIVSLNQYKYYSDQRMEQFLISSDDGGLTWSAHQKVGGYPVTVDWEAEMAQYGAHYSQLIIDGNDLLFATRGADGNADNHHDTNLLTFSKAENFRTSIVQTFVDGSLIIDENSERIEDANGIAIIKDQSSNFNSPFQTQALNVRKPNWVTDGIQFDGASYLRLMHDRSISLDYNNNISFFFVLDNLANLNWEFLLNNDNGLVQSNLPGVGGWYMTPDAIGIEERYMVFTTNLDMTIGNNYIVAMRYDHVNGFVYNYLNGANRGQALNMSGITWDTDHGVLTTSYTGSNMFETFIGRRNIGSDNYLNTKVKAFHVMPNLTIGEFEAYQTALNAIYSIY